MKPPLLPSFEILESRMLLAQEDSVLSSIEAFLSMSWEEAAVTGSGMFIYGAAAFIIGEGGDLSVTRTSFLFTSIGIILGYHVGSGIAHDWLALDSDSGYAEI